MMQLFLHILLLLSIYNSQILSKCIHNFLSYLFFFLAKHYIISMSHSHGFLLCKIIILIVCNFY